MPFGLIEKLKGTKPFRFIVNIWTWPLPLNVRGEDPEDPGPPC